MESAKVMSMKITFELSNKDLKYFRHIMDEVRSRSTDISEKELDRKSVV